MNSVNLIGRLTRSPELSKTRSGKSVTNFSIACDRGFGDNKKTDFINCQAWGSQAEFACTYLVKGNLVAIEGSIQSRNYDDKSGNKVYIQEVLLRTIKNLSPRSETTQQQNQQPQISDDSGLQSDSFEDIGLDFNSDDFSF